MEETFTIIYPNGIKVINRISEFVPLEIKNGDVYKYEDIIKMEKYDDLNKYSKSGLSRDYDLSIEFYDAYRQYSNGSDDIIEEMITNTSYNNYISAYTWNLHKLFNKHQVKGDELFEALLTDETPMGYGHYSYSKDVMIDLKAEYKRIQEFGDYTAHYNKLYKSMYFNWWNGIPFKGVIYDNYEMDMQKSTCFEGVFVLKSIFQLIAKKMGIVIPVKDDEIHSIQIINDIIPNVPADKDNKTSFMNKAKKFIGLFKR